MRPELSVVIAVRDNWRQLSRGLNSIANQSSPPPYEIIVVDDGSAHPAPPEIIARARRVPMCLHRQIGLGIAAARNRGVALAAAEVILFIDSDCVLEKSCLGNLAAALRCHAHDDAFQLAVSSPGKTLVQKIEALRLGAVQASLLIESGYIRYANTSGLAVRSRYTRKHRPLFDAALVRGSDTLLLARFVGQGMQPRFLPSCHVYHCPEMPFHQYARKHYWIGRQDHFARRQLQASGRVLMNWSQRRQTLRRIWRASRQRDWSLFCVAATVLCYGIEWVGRLTSRLLTRVAG